LRYNPALLVMTVFGLGLVFLAPWWLMLTQSGTAGWGGGFAVAWMVALYLPVLAFIAALGYGRWPCLWSRCSIWAARSIRRGPIIVVGGNVERAGASRSMNELTASDLASGKGHKDENFPVASWLVRPDARAPIMAYYRFARASDDVADDESTSSAEKLRLLAHMRAGLDGKGAPEAMALGDVCRERGIDLAHAHDLLDAFVQDCRVNRYEDWDGLIGYCRLSAMPVGRFVLDVHGEDRATWAMNDALCAALQIINHLQDCGKDYRGSTGSTSPCRC
jgi:hypothetical protein